MPEKKTIKILVSEDGLDINLPNGKKHIVAAFGSSRIDTLDAIRAICYYFDTEVETKFHENNKKRRFP